MLLNWFLIGWLVNALTKLASDWLVGERVHQHLDDALTKLVSDWLVGERVNEIGF